MVEIDCKGLACPGPVLKAKEVVETQRPPTIRVIVDNSAAKENVSRFLGTQGYDICVETAEGSFCVIGTKKGEDIKEPLARENTKEAGKKILVFITSRTLGHGDEKLGTSLMLNFLKTLKELPNLWRIILLNEGVKLASDEGESIAVLKELEQSGVSILVCGTCLSYYNLIEQKKVGETTNMLDVVTSLGVADSVINIT